MKGRLHCYHHVLKYTPLANCAIAVFTEMSSHKCCNCRNSSVSQHSGGTTVHKNLLYSLQEKREVQRFPTQRHDQGGGNANYPNLIITYCVHVSNSVHLLCANLKNTKEGCQSSKDDCIKLQTYCGSKASKKKKIT
jgi:hypothetical protein